ncbi:hypothetical protein ACU8KH_00458 [Lachancea thermotolerans]
MSKSSDDTLDPESWVQFIFTAYESDVIPFSLENHILVVHLRITGALKDEIRHLTWDTTHTGLPLKPASRKTITSFGSVEYSDLVDRKCRNGVCVPISFSSEFRLVYFHVGISSQQLTPLSLKQKKFLTLVETW